MAFETYTPEESELIKALRAQRQEATDPRKVAEAAIMKLAKAQAQRDGTSEATASVAVLETPLGGDLYALFRRRPEDIAALTTEQRAALIAEIEAALAQAKG